jgi:hypothetical protein
VNSKEQANLFTPPFARNKRAWKLLVEAVGKLMEANPSKLSADVAVESVRRELLTTEVKAEIKSVFQVTSSVLCDLRLHGWSFEVNKSNLRLIRPNNELAPDVERERIRRMHAVNRNVQLIKQSVRTFIKGLEKIRASPNGWVSIFSLMRDGRELSQKLNEVLRLKDMDEQLFALRAVVKPYLQLVVEKEICSHTGLPLGDIWRYFRHTWASEYQTVPGRNLMFLVRDSAAPFHPVIGIACLASPVVHLTLRDEWIGWAPQTFIAELRENPSAAWAKWVDEKLKQLIAGIFLADLIKDRVIVPAELRNPTEDVIARLEEEADACRKQHRLHPTKSLHKTPTKMVDDIEWKRRSETHLFRSKRCATLAELLRAKLRLQHAGFSKATKACLAKALSTSEGRQAVETIRKNIKAIHIGNDVLDISVCGAIAPYSELLGGKLVAMLLTSPEIVQMYAQRYGRASSIIASSMAGQKVSRRARLVTLTTTSLYGSELNQYTRIRVPAVEVGGDINQHVEYRKLGLTQGQGSFHFSAVTVDLVEVLLGQIADSRTVNSIFGEGVSPRLRKIRSGLNLCGFPSDEVLTHGSPRIVYGIALTTNQRDCLLERGRQPDYIFPQRASEETTKLIADYWQRRWLYGRIHRPEILERVARHTLVSPVQHGARVSLPKLFEEEPLLFNQE